MWDLRVKRCQHLNLICKGSLLKTTKTQIMKEQPHYGDKALPRFIGPAISAKKSSSGVLVDNQ